MKSFLVIGMGRFGHHLVTNLMNQGAEVMIVDEVQERMDDLLNVVTSAKIGDCTKEEVLKTLGVGNFDMCIVCIGTNFQSSLEITSLLKEMGAKYVVSKASGWTMSIGNLSESGKVQPQSEQACWRQSSFIQSWFGSYGLCNLPH